MKTKLLVNYPKEKSKYFIAHRFMTGTNVFILYNEGRLIHLVVYAMLTTSECDN
jgi:hypothetical protein